MSSTLGVRQWFTTEAGDLARHAREFGISFVGDDDEEVILKKECVSPTLPPIPPLIPLSSVRQVNSASEDSEPGGYGGVFMVNSDTPEELRIFGEGEVGVTAPFSEVDRLHCETQEGEVQVKVLTDTCSEGVDCCADEAPMCTVVLDPLPTDLLRSLTEDGQISAEKAVRSCEWEQPQTLPLEQCSSNGRRSSSESAVRGLLRDLVSTVATRHEGNGEGDDSLARSQNESLLHQPPVATHDSHAIDYDENNIEDDASRDERRARHRKSETPRKAIRRRHERRSSSSGGKSKRRKRSTSCSTTSSTGSTTSRHHHHHKHRKHRRRRSKTSADELDPPPTPRVNPIFVWIKQDDTRIVEVLCEDYDKRNRIRITKTAQGWRAIPRTERLASAGSVTALSNSTTDSSAEAPLYTVTSSLVSQDDTHPTVAEEEDISACSITKDIEFGEVDENEMEEEQEVEAYEQQEEDDTYDVANEIPDDIQEQMCTDTEMEPTDLSIPKSTCDEIEIIPIKGINPILPAAPTIQPKLSPMSLESTITEQSPVRPAHQPKPQHKSMFLESLLSSPRKCHQITRHELKSDEPQPLDLGVSLNRSSGSPTVSCSEERKPLPPPPPPDAEFQPKIKCLKVEDITLKNLLNKTVNLNKITQRKAPTDVILNSSKSQKSRLLELLTSEPAPASQLTLDQDLDPVTQLKKILSDPDLSVPDPLLVPRDQLHSLLTCPAREIPHLLTMRPELRLPDALAYPALVRDPDILVVSLTHLQRLLEKPEDDTGNYITLRDWQRYQTELLDSHLKQNHHQSINSGDVGKGELDAATAAALNQMLWLPYLTQLEAAAVACGNNQEFLTMLNAVFPPSNYPQVQGGAAPFLPPFSVSPTDYKTHMELQQTLALWQEAMMQAAVNSPPISNNNNTTSSNNNLSGKNISGTNSYSNKNHHSSNGRFPHVAKKCNSSARTSPISPNFQHQQRNNQEYLSSNGYNHHQYNQQRSQLQQPVRNISGSQRQMKSEIRTPTENEHSNIKVSELSKPKVTCKSLINLLSNSRKQEQTQDSITIKKCPTSPSPQVQQHSHLLAALGNPPSNMPQLVPITQDTSPTPTTNPIDLSGRRSKLKVKQHLVDPAITPRLLKQDADKVTHTQLWHPLFGSQKTSYNSPWQWTTVMVNGE
ncbi:hypothetical protein L9F63_021579 [Diploptera punctata]|uniref:Uncharacterized protein n=1 Tax=Diploptera punctata TaxID=6984 RepID=A0AAD7ZP98_DIPPU|nr:hypothetical protein L9F63_021579 [Diploptera punctata]